MIKVLQEEAIIESMVIHKIGIKAAEEADPRRDNIYSENASLVSVENQECLKEYFLKVNKSPDYFRFIDTEACVAAEARRVFADKTKLLQSSKRLAEALFGTLPDNDETNSDFFVVYFKDFYVIEKGMEEVAIEEPQNEQVSEENQVLEQASVESEFIEDNRADAIGIFKACPKEKFLKIVRNDKGFYFQEEEGLGLKKIDKAALILNVKGEEGYLVKAMDNSKGKEPYWIDKFLEAKAIETEYFNTESFMQLCKDFDEQVLEKNNVDHVRRVQFLQDSLDYFQKRQESAFDGQEFNNEVMGQNQDSITSFEQFKNEYRKSHEVEIPDSFDIDETAVKKSKRYLRSVIKLDKNFHIYVHSNPERIQKGRDDNNRNFYQLFFDYES